MARFTSECDLCAELLTAYIAASNDVVDRRERAHSGQQPSSRQLASALIDNALKRRNQNRRKLLAHKDQTHS